jgi:hypothetical protein
LLLLVLVRPLSDLLAVVAAMDVVMVLVVLLRDRATALAGATAPVAATTVETMAMAMAVALEVALKVAVELALAALNNIPWCTTRRPSFEYVEQLRHRCGSIES